MIVTGFGSGPASFKPQRKEGGRGVIRPQNQSQRLDLRSTHFDLNGNHITTLAWNTIHCLLQTCVTIAKLRMSVTCPCIHFLDRILNVQVPFKPNRILFRSLCLRRSAGSAGQDCHRGGLTSVVIVVSGFFGPLLVGSVLLLHAKQLFDVADPTYCDADL